MPHAAASSAVVRIGSQHRRPEWLGDVEPARCCLRGGGAGAVECRRSIAMDAVSPAAGDLLLAADGDNGTTGSGRDSVAY